MPQGTSNSDLVVPRRVQLLAQKFYTYHDESDPSHGRKSWYLDRRCQLSPKSPEEIPAQPTTKSVRPRKTWTITASLKGKGEHVQLVRLACGTRRRQHGTAMQRA